MQADRKQQEQKDVSADVRKEPSYSFSWVIGVNEVLKTKKLQDGAGSKESCTSSDMFPASPHAALTFRSLST